VAATYATVADLTADPWSVDPMPSNASRLLASASRLVRRATVTAVYDTDALGVATDSTVAGALRDATCAQVVAWITAGVDPAGGGVQLGERLVAAKSLASGSVTYDNGAAASVTAMDARAASATRLCPDAVLILAEAGLVGGHIGTTR